MPHKDFWELVKSDYSQVLFRLACAYDKQKHMALLIIGLLEFFPQGKEADLLECNWQSLNTNNGYRIFFRRFLRDVDWSVYFYKNALTQLESSFYTEDVENTIIHGTLEQTTHANIPYLANHETIPFLPLERECRRIFSAYPITSKNVLDVICYDKIMHWLEDRLCFDIVKDYPEFAGSLHCIFQNPVYHSLHCRLIPGPHEGVQFSFEPYPGKHTDNLTICMLQKYHHGHVVQKPTAVTENSLILDAAGELWKSSSLVWDNDRGLLDFSSFHAFIRQMNLGITVNEGRRRVSYDNGTERIDVETAISRSVSKFVIGENFDDGEDVVNVGERIMQSSLSRARREAAKDQEQYICHDKEEAKKYVRSLFARAHERLIIIDPYFNDTDAVNYLASLENLDICPQIYVTADSLMQKDKKNGETKTWEKLDNVIRQLEGTVNAEFLVMPGEGRFHDRFFIIDDSVYLSGNSLNHIGNRLSVIIRLPDGEGILIEQGTCREEVTEFGKWVKMHKCVSEGGENGKTEESH